MKKFFDQLKPQERRWVVGIAVVVFIILNYLLVWPQFGEWKRNNNRIKSAQKEISDKRPEIANIPKYQSAIQRLESEGARVTPEDQASQFTIYYNARANENHVRITSSGNMTPHSINDFFMEQDVTLNVMAEEKDLVNFLYNLGASNSTVRVRSMTLRPDPSRHQLNATITLVASYLKKAPTPPPQTAAKPPVAKTNAAPPKPAAPANKPSAAPPRATASTNKPSAAPPRAIAPTNKPANINK